MAASESGTCEDRVGNNENTHEDYAGMTSFDGYLGYRKMLSSDSVKFN